MKRALSVWNQGAWVMVNCFTTELLCGWFESAQRQPDTLSSIALTDGFGQRKIGLRQA